jgi:hypothetical protein
MRVVAAVSLLCLALPASAQVYGPSLDRPAPRVPTIDSRAPRAETWREQAAIRDSIGDARRSGQIDRSTARGLRRNAAATDALANRMRVGGMSDAEQRELDARVEVERSLVNAARGRGK